MLKRSSKTANKIQVEMQQVTRISLLQDKCTSVALSDSSFSQQYSSSLDPRALSHDQMPDEPIELLDLSELYQIDRCPNVVMDGDFVGEPKCSVWTQDPDFSVLPAATAAAVHGEPDSPARLDILATIRTLGNPTAVCSSAFAGLCVSSAVATVPIVDSPFSIRNIDELLKELEIADHLDAHQCRSTGNTAVHHSTFVDPDVFSLLEIDELIEQLGDAELVEHLGATLREPEAQLLEVDPVELVNGLGIAVAPNLTEAAPLLVDTEQRIQRLG
ncbi:hypothetical protein EC988_005099, partial [Linderina pennispora]